MTLGRTTPPHLIQRAERKKSGSVIYFAHKMAISLVSEELTSIKISYMAMIVICRAVVFFFGVFLVKFRIQLVSRLGSSTHTTTHIPRWCNQIMYLSTQNFSSRDNSVDPGKVGICLFSRLKCRSPNIDNAMGFEFSEKLTAWRQDS